jgi:hypothetical protein
MQVDYHDAHNRHWDDAEHLFDDSRWANADQLYGLSAECGLKRLMMAFGMNIDTTTGSPTEKKDWVHANKAWQRYESYRAGHYHGAKYSLPANDPFINWDVSQRYANRSNFDQALAESHKQGANAVRSLVNQAILEGIVT